MASRTTEPISTARQKSSNGAAGKLGLDNEQLLEMYRQMCLIRQFELKAGEHYSRGNIRGFLHLYEGQEAVGVGAIAALDERDYVVSAYRDHGHALARGLDPNRAMAELFGRATGLSKGKGGSMHFFDVAKKFMGGHAIVAGQIPLALGLALSQQYQKTGGLTICFFGDGSTNQGVYHECMNLAAVWKLPVLFFLENNKYGMGTAVDRVRASTADFYTDAERYGIDSAVVDGMDVLAVRETTEAAVGKIRAGDGPVFIEAKTFRFVGHSLADGQKYRDAEEIEQWRRRDPITTYPELLVKHGAATLDEIAAIKAGVDRAVDEAVKFAEESPDPSPDELFDGIYA